MAVNENNIEREFPTTLKGNARGPSLHPLHEAAMRIAGLGMNRPREKTRDLVGLLLTHAARAWRYTQPEASIHLHIGSHSGRAPIHIRLR
ncbi:hypothetical protein [Neorhizobium sp. JUb45]|uniref:hypothetical protein n=1 Tax=unclassified Neorhizobium TaxID=2629175 RepID=UPI001053FF0B|nr:hypothetical protein [Neorhizobium sp. JUb45]TCR05071.1 hypothetical protein EDF70_1021187 [Neorhizobium sp. JUb45]